MEFNKITRGAKREMNDEQTVYEILDAGFLCHVAFQHEGQTMMIPTAYGRKDDFIFLHGSRKNFMLQQICNGQTACISVTHLDGVVLARTLFDTSANYRSAVLFGKAQIVEEETERLEGMKIITENIIKGRFDEVKLGTENEVAATLVVKFKIESASAKVRNGGPMGDEDEKQEVWSGVIPLSLKAHTPIVDVKNETQFEYSESIKSFLKKYE
jgi:nitroimidazol reductase NimA-like FMN-containing flavoprotein (pyridoxamine 5'-phosphate oxidase superfamily)